MYYPRLIEPQIKEQLANNKALIITGMRRVGKTTLLQKIYADLPNNKVWFDFDNPLDVKYFEDIDYNDVYRNIVNRGDLDATQKIYVFIDEVQNYPAISKIVKYLLDHYSIKFILTGSASYYLKNLFPESLADRKIIFEIFPLQFEEFLLFKRQNITTYKKCKAKAVITELDYELHDALYEEYITWGGFPGVVAAENHSEKIITLKDIFTSYYQKEVLTLSDYRKTTVIRDLILLLAQRTGNQLDIIKLSQELGITRATIYNYIAFLQATYFIHLINPFSRNVDREISGTQKVYFCDNGILKVITQLNEGQLLENAIYNQLRHHGTVHYYRNASHKELDFIVNKTIAYEVKATASPYDYTNVEKMQQQLKLERGYVISKKFTQQNRHFIYGQFL